MKNFLAVYFSVAWGLVSVFSNTVIAGEANLCDLVRGLERAQGIYQFSDGRAEPESWEWEVGSGMAARNVTGVVAAALSQAPAVCSSSQAVERYARVQLGHHLDGEFLYDGDVEALARAANLLGENQYREVAKVAFERRYGDATGEEIVGRWLWTRVGSQRPLIGFDASLAIRAALAVGATGKARDIANATVRAMPLWEKDGGSSDFSDTGRGALLEALKLLKDDSFNEVADHLVDDMILSQRKDGSWPGYSTQSTAYAIRGLSNVDDPLAQSAAESGRKWLASRANRDELLREKNPEVSAEALIALAIAR